MRVRRKGGVGLKLGAPHKTEPANFPSLWQSYIVSGKDYPRVELDTHGCGLRCSALSDPSQDLQFIVAGDECVYLYQPDERGPCFAFEGHKLIAHWFRGYLVIVSRDRKVSPK